MNIELISSASRGSLFGASIGLLVGATAHVAETILWHKPAPLDFCDTEGRTYVFRGLSLEMKMHIRSLHSWRQAFTVEFDKAAVLTQHAIDIGSGIAGSGSALRRLTRLQRCVARADAAWRSMYYAAKMKRDLVACEQINTAMMSIHQQFVEMVEAAREAWRSDN